MEKVLFNSRGIGLDTTPDCFVCGGPTRVYNNIAAFVKTQDDGQKVVAMFQKGARLDWRPHEPVWIQIKIGACDNHRINLERLNYFCSDGTITPVKVADAAALKPVYIAESRVSASRKAMVQTLAEMLKHDLQQWATATDLIVWGGTEPTSNYPISIIETDGGYTRQLVSDKDGLICELHQEKHPSLTVSLRLAKQMPVGPWKSSLVIELFKNAHAKEVVVPASVVMPKIVSATIKPERISWRDHEKEYVVRITFENAHFGAPAFEKQTDLINNALNTGLDSWDCCHFFTNVVVMSFPSHGTAQVGLKRVQKLYA